MKVMETKSKLESSLKEAMRAGDDLRKRTIRLVLSSVRLAEIEKGSLLDEAGIAAILQKEIKSRQEAIQDAQRANRPELAQAAEAEIAVLESYLPAPFSPEELEVLATKAIAESGAASPGEMGKVMKILVPRLQGRATPGEASQVVRNLLES